MRGDSGSILTLGLVLMAKGSISAEVLGTQNSHTRAKGNILRLYCLERLEKKSYPWGAVELKIGVLKNRPGMGSISGLVFWIRGKR